MIEIGHLAGIIFIKDSSRVKRMRVVGKPRVFAGVAIAIAAVAGIGLVLYAGMGSVAANARPNAAGESMQDSASIDNLPEIAQGTAFTDENFGMLYDNFDAFASSSIDVDITGQIVGMPWMEDTLAAASPANVMSFQMYQGRNILDYRYVSVSYDLGESLAVDRLDCVRVTGTIAGHRVFTDQHGSYLLPNIADAKVESLDCVDYLYPAERTITVEVTETHDGISVTLEKVEFAREHTRAYLVVSNNNPELINFLTGARIAYQGHHHYTHLEGALNVHMPKIGYAILPGEVQHGIVLFKPLDYTHDSTFKFAAKNGYNSHIFAFEVPSPVHGEEHGDSGDLAGDHSEESAADHEVLEH